jgi:hypothetical protein
MFTTSLIAPHDGASQDVLGRLHHVLGNPLPALQDTCDAVISAKPPSPPDDDIVLLPARTRTLDADHVASWTFPK